MVVTGVGVGVGVGTVPERPVAYVAGVARPFILDVVVV